MTLYNEQLAILLTALLMGATPLYLWIEAGIVIRKLQGESE